MNDVPFMNDVIVSFCQYRDIDFFFMSGTVVMLCVVTIFHLVLSSNHCHVVGEMFLLYAVMFFSNVASSY